MRMNCLAKLKRFFNKMGRKTTICFSFDDGRADNISLAKDYLVSNRIPATFNITTGYIDGTAEKGEKPSDKPAMSVDDVRYLYNNPLFEIALHGDKHKNTPEDVERGRKKLVKWLNLADDCALGFASPSSFLCMNNMGQYSEYLGSDIIKYVRIGDNRETNSALFTQMMNNAIKKGRLIGKILNRLSDTFFYQKYVAIHTCKKSMLKSIDSKVLYSYTVYRGTSPKVIISLIKYAMRHGLSLILMMHSVDNNDLDYNIYTYRRSDFEYIAKWLCQQRNSHRVKIATVNEMYQSLSK